MFPGDIRPAPAQASLGVNFAPATEAMAGPSRKISVRPAQTQPCHPFYLRLVTDYMCGVLRETLRMTERNKTDLADFGLREILEVVSGELILGNPGDCFRGLHRQPDSQEGGDFYCY